MKSYLFDSFFSTSHLEFSLQRASQRGVNLSSLHDSLIQKTIERASKFFDYYDIFLIEAAIDKDHLSKIFLFIGDNNKGKAQQCAWALYHACSDVSLALRAFSFVTSLSKEPLLREDFSFLMNHLHQEQAKKVD